MILFLFIKNETYQVSEKSGEAGLLVAVDIAIRIDIAVPVRRIRIRIDIAVRIGIGINRGIIAGRIRLRCAKAGSLFSEYPKAPSLRPGAFANTFVFAVSTIHSAPLRPYGR